jgi:hypothetical protein
MIEKSKPAVKQFLDRLLAPGSASSRLNVKSSKAATSAVGLAYLYRGELDKLQNLVDV